MTFKHNLRTAVPPDKSCAQLVDEACDPRQRGLLSAQTDGIGTFYTLS